jgi:N-acetylglutamate synthase-like GNAT family acetyltransferase
MIFRRIDDVALIPIDLVEQIPNTDVNQFYQTLQNLKSMPHHVVELFQDEKLNIVGFAWSVLDPIGKEWHVNTVSMVKECQGSGKYLKEYIEHLKQILKDSAIKKVTWCTDRPAFYEKLGFKRSDEVYLEYDLKQEVKDDGQEETRS